MICSTENRANPLLEAHRSVCHLRMIDMFIPKRMIQRTFVSGLMFLTAATTPEGNSQQAIALSAAVKELDSAQPLSPRKVSRILGVSLKCASQSCEAKDFRIKDVSVSHLDFRFGGKSSVLVMKIATEICISSDMMKRQFGSGKMLMGCTDGVSCPYMLFQGRWRHVMFPLPEQAHGPSCLDSITVNSDLG